jgi:hypothetical protein
MSWRKFLTLLRGLGPQSATVTAISSRVQMGGRARKPANLVQGAENTNRVFDSLFKPPA